MWETPLCCYSFARNGPTWIWAVTLKGVVNSTRRSRWQETHVMHCSDPAGNVNEKLEEFLTTGFGIKLQKYKNVGPRQCSDIL